MRVHHGCADLCVHDRAEKRVHDALVSLLKELLGKHARRVVNEVLREPPR